MHVYNLFYLHYKRSKLLSSTYNHLVFGIFPVKFVTAQKKVISIELRVNEFIDYDPYNFIKK